MFSEFFSWLKKPTANRRDYYNTLEYDEWKAGRQVAKELEAKGFRHPNYGSLYIGLRRLEEENLVESEDHFDEDGRYRNFRKKDGSDWVDDRQEDSDFGLVGSLSGA
jgi:hypothetical protein